MRGKEITTEEKKQQEKTKNDEPRLMFICQTQPEVQNEWFFLNLVLYSMPVSLCLCVYIVTGAIASRINNVLRATWANRYILLYISCTLVVVVVFTVNSLCRLQWVYFFNCLLFFANLYYWQTGMQFRLHDDCFAAWHTHLAHILFQTHFPLVFYLCIHIIHREKQRERDLNKIKRRFSFACSFVDAVGTELTLKDYVIDDKIQQNMRDDLHRLHWKC